MPEERFDAGVFVLFPTGWALIKRKSFPTAESAHAWMDRSARSQFRMRQCLRARTCIIDNAAESNPSTLDEVLVDYEQKRGAGDPDFTAPAATNAAPKIAKPRSGITAVQGQYLAFIDLYTRRNGQPPGELDMQRHFRVSSAAVHGMVLMLKRKGLISKSPGVARSIRVLVPREELPELKVVDR
jgi:hypothetical protein